MPSKICVKLKTEVRLRPNRPTLSREQRLMDVLDLECGKNVLHERIAQAVSASAHRLDAPRHLPSNGGRPLHIAADHLRWSRQYPGDRGHAHTVLIPLASASLDIQRKRYQNGGFRSITQLWFGFQPCFPPHILNKIKVKTAPTR